MKITITITKEDILNGRRCDPNSCPVGRALSRAGVSHFGVIGPTVVIVDGQDRRRIMPLPENVSEWILEFDACRQVKPLVFELALPAHGTPQRTDGAQAARGALPTDQVAVVA